MIVLNNLNKILDIPGVLEVWIFFRGKLTKVWPENKEDIESCFAQGYWIPEYPWTNFLGWKNNE